MLLQAISMDTTRHSWKRVWCLWPLWPLMLWQSYLGVYGVEWLQDINIPLFLVDTFPATSFLKGVDGHFGKLADLIYVFRFHTFLCNKSQRCTVHLWLSLIFLFSNFCPVYLIVFIATFGTVLKKRLIIKQVFAGLLSLGALTWDLIALHWYFGNINKVILTHWLCWLKINVCSRLLAVIYKVTFVSAIFPSRFGA